MYYIYHIPGIKIGCTNNIERRVIKQQHTQDFEILEQYDDIDTASERERILIEEYGYQQDKRLYSDMVNMVTIEQKRLGGRNSGRTHIESGFISALGKLATSENGWLRDYQQDAGQRALRTGQHKKMREAGYEKLKNEGNKKLQKLTRHDAEEIKRLYSTGKYTQRKLGKMFGVSQHPIKQILKGRDTKHRK